MSDVTLKEHLEALRKADGEFYDERDRRYLEVNIEKEKALKIKETADLAALGLAREIQTYKDEKANELREQIANERGMYAKKEEVNKDISATIEKIEATVKPLVEYVLSQQGRSGGLTAGWGYILSGIGLLILVATYFK